MGKSDIVRAVCVYKLGLAWGAQNIHARNSFRIDDYGSRYKISTVFFHNSNGQIASTVRSHVVTSLST
jgi:hypothetical protein